MSKKNPNLIVSVSKMPDSDGDFLANASYKNLHYTTGYGKTKEEALAHLKRILHHEMIGSQQYLTDFINALNKTNV